MNNVEKIFYIMELLNLTSRDVARKFGVSESLISSWKTRDSLKNVHIYAFCSIYNIPIDIFRLGKFYEYNEFDTKESIIKHIKEYQMKKNGRNRCKTDDTIIERLTSNGFYCYNFSSSSNLNINLHKNILKIEKDYTVLNLNGNSEVIREGTIEINEYQSIIKLKSLRTNTYLYIVFDNDITFENNIFFGTFISKTKVLHNTIIGISILSKYELSPYTIKFILQNRASSQIEIDTKLKERLLKVLENNFE